VTLDEFNDVYAKNNGGKDSAQVASADDKAKFLDLYVNFKLKVKEAYERGYDKDTEIQAEPARLSPQPLRFLFDEQGN